MSFQAYEAVWQSSASKSSARTTLLAMAEFASKRNGFTCRASVDTLADMVKVSSRQIQKNIQALVELGEIEVFEATGRGNYNVYDLKPLMRKHEPEFTLSGEKPEEKGELHDEKGEVEFANGEPHYTLPEEERVNSSSKRVNHSSRKGEPQFARTLNNPTEPIDGLIDFFTRKTGLAPPAEGDPDFEKKWRGPMRQILSMCDGSLEDAEVIVDEAVGFLWSSSKYHCSSPKSLVVTASNMAGARASPNGHQESEPAGFAAIREFLADLEDEV